MLLSRLYCTEVVPLLLWATLPEMPPTSPRASITCLDLMTTHGRRAMPSGPSYHSSNSPITDY